MKLPIKVKLFLWFLKITTRTPIESLPPRAVREAIARKKKLAKGILRPKLIQLFEIKDQLIPGRDAPIPIRIYKPSNAVGLPVIVYFHGGGFVISSIDTHDHICRRVCQDSQSIVVSVEYRLAPEHKFPAALHDSYDATKWAYLNAESIGGDQNKLVVMGDSAGGNLAAATCLLAKEKHSIPIAFQVLLYPCTDARFVSESVEEFKDGYLLTKSLMVWFLEHYKRDDDDTHHPHVSMLLAKDLSGLPPALVITAGFDPLRDEGKAYAMRLKESGCEVTYQDFPKLIHGFFSFPWMSRSIDDAFALISKSVKKTLDENSMIKINQS